MLNFKYVFLQKIYIIKQDVSITVQRSLSTKRLTMISAKKKSCFSISFYISMFESLRYLIQNIVFKTWFGKFSVGEMSGWGTVQSRKCPVGELSSRGNVRSGNCPVGELSGRGIRSTRLVPSSILHWSCYLRGFTSSCPLAILFFDL